MTPDMEEDFADVAAALAAAAPPAVRLVGVPAVLAAAAACEATRARNWKRLAAGCAAVAAGLFAFAFVPKVNVNFGDAPAPVAQIPAPPRDDSAILARLARLERNAADRSDAADAGAKLKDLKDLVAGLAADVADRDDKQQRVVGLIVNRLREFEDAAVSKWAEDDRTIAALYTLSQSPPKKEPKP